MLITFGLCKGRNEKRFKNVFEKIKNAEPVKSVNKEKLNINSNILPKSILEKVKEKGPEIQSILSKQQQA